MVSASTRNSREAARLPRAISSICFMLSTSLPKSFLFIRHLRPIFVDGPKHFLLGRAQIVLQTLTVNQQQPDLRKRNHVKVNHSHATALALAAGRPPYLA